MSRLVRSHRSSSPRRLPSPDQRPRRASVGEHLAQWFGPEIDLAALDDRKAAAPRFVAGIAAAAVVCINPGFLMGALVLSVHLLAQFYGWAATRRQVRGLPCSIAGRLNYLAAAGLIASVWTFVACIYWFSGTVGLRYAAMVILAVQLIDAQAFSPRSRATVVVVGAGPALAMVILPLVFGGLMGTALITSIAGFTLAIGYIAYAANANLAAGRALRAAQAELEKTSFLDPLTALGNRRMFIEDMLRMKAMSNRQGTRFAMILVDLDHLKRVNDTLGHDVGDALLVEVARRLRNVVRHADGLARLGGDEFGILMADAGNPDDREAFCARIMTAFAHPIELEDRRLPVTLSIGVAVFPEDGTSQEALYKAADLALYDAKNNGRNTWRSFLPSLAA